MFCFEVKYADGGVRLVCSETLVEAQEKRGVEVLRSAQSGSEVLWVTDIYQD